jgi:hypothetical protein
MFVATLEEELLDEPTELELLLDAEELLELLPVQSGPNSRYIGDGQLRPRLASFVLDSCSLLASFSICCWVSVGIIVCCKAAWLTVTAIVNDPSGFGVGELKLITSSDPPT